jgi:hypothetical protein
MKEEAETNMWVVDGEVRQMRGIMELELYQTFYWSPPPW